MPIRNLKTHLVSIAIISAVVIVIYAVFAPHDVKSGTQNQLQGDRYIQIDSASWGVNCNPYIDDALRSWKPSETPALAAKNPKPHRVNPDNALAPISNACNGKMTCAFEANPEFFGDDPMTSCPKKLEVRYRCFAFDKLTIKEFNPGGEVRIDCTEATPKANLNAH